MYNDAFLYNLNSGNLISIQNITSDSSNYFLPMTGGSDFEFSNDNFYTSDGEYLYTAHSSLSMFDAKELNIDRKIKYKQVLAEYFLKGKRKCNPVIVQLKLKDNL